MGKRKQFTDFQRNSILYGHKIGHSSRQIAKIVGVMNPPLLSWVWRETSEEWSPDCVSVTAPVECSGDVFQHMDLDQSFLWLVQLLVQLLVQCTGRSFKSKFYLQWSAFSPGWFQDDNASPHRSKIAIEFREEKSLRTLSWPAQSPDLNPIENLWDEIKRSLKNEKRKPKNLNELERLVKKTWRSIPQDKIKRLVESMPRRVQAVIDANGGPTKY